MWALGEFFTEDDEAIKLWDVTNKEALSTARWWSSWILTMSFLPVIILYIFWVPLSYMGKIPAPQPPPPRRILVRKRRRSSTSSPRSGSGNSLSSLASYQQGTLAGGDAAAYGGAEGDDRDDTDFGAVGSYSNAMERAGLLSREDVEEIF